MAAVIELGGAGAGMIGHAGGFFERTAAFEDNQSQDGGGI